MRDLAGAIPQMGRLFDEHTNVFRALAEVELERPRRDAVAAAVAEVSGNLAGGRGAARGGDPRPASAPGAPGSCSTSNTGSPATRSSATLDWAATTLLEDVRRRNEAAAGRNPPT